MIWIILGPILYVIATCLANKVDVVDYVKEHKVVLTLTTLLVLAIHLFGKTASAAVLTALLMPALAAYSIPSLLAKLGKLWERITAIFIAPKE